MLQNLWYQVGRSIVCFYVRQVMRADVYQDAPFPPGAKIIAVNHPSTNDPAFVTILSREHMTILIKETVFKVPLFGRSLRMSGHVPVVAGKGRAALEEGVRLLRAGRTVMIFPEGEISTDKGEKKAHTGVARLALATGVPVVPVGISLDCRRRKLIYSKIGGEIEPSSWYLRGPYAMTVGEAICFDGSQDDHEQVRAVTGHIMRRISNLRERGEIRLSSRRALPARRTAGAPLLSPAGRSTLLPHSTLQIAWRGTWLGMHQSARIFSNTAAFRMVESLLVFILMFTRQLVG
jgi:1-acyl-sn-glycerol-3-phosphate acyltransferase